MNAPAPLRSFKATAMRLLGYVRPYRTGAVLGILSFFLSAAIEPAIPALLKQLVDDGFKPDMGFAIWLVPLIVIGLFAVRGLLAFSGSYLMAWSTSLAVLALRTDLMHSIMRADASLFNHLSPGVAASRVINEPQNATSSLTGALITLLRDGTTLIALLGYLLYLNWQLTLVSFTTMPLLFYVVRKVQKRIIAVGGQSYESQIRLVGIVDDIARAWRVVRTFDASDFERDRFATEARRLRQSTMKSAAAGATMTPLTQIVASMGVALIISLALLEASRGGATVGEFVAFITAMLMTISPMRHLTDVTQPIVGGLIQARGSFELMDTPPEPDEGRREIENCAGHLQFDQTTVVYPGSDVPALARLALDIPAGRTIALVGPSGSGKTTVVSTMLGFVAPASGRVLLDGIDIADLRKASLRRQFAVVSQDIVLFPGTIEDNVAYAQALDPARVETALRAANLWDFVQSLPDGVRTIVGADGSRLSGGQRQRLAIARALYREAPIWVFDEATSALDTESERIVQQSIEQWQGSKTLILIAHRLSTVRKADVIYVLADGRVVEGGSHEALMERSGLYAGMVQAQALE